MADAVAYQHQHLHHLHHLRHPHHPTTTIIPPDLDLRVWDQRQLVRVIAKLAVEEPGEHFPKMECRWTQTSDPIPGWSLPVTWMYNEGDESAGTGGVREQGALLVEFVTDARRGCVPDWKFRKSLNTRFFCGRKAAG